MVKNTKNNNGGEQSDFGGGQAVSGIKSSVGTWFPIVWKVVLLYGVWLGLMHTVMTNATGLATRQFAAIGYWFGWLFLGMTVLLGVFLAITGWLDRRRFNIRRSRN